MEHLDLKIAVLLLVRSSCMLWKTGINFSSCAPAFPLTCYWLTVVVPGEG